MNARIKELVQRRLPHFFKRFSIRDFSVEGAVQRTGQKFTPMEVVEALRIMSFSGVVVQLPNAAGQRLVQQWRVMSPLTKAQAKVEIERLWPLLAESPSNTTSNHIFRFWAILSAEHPSVLTWPVALGVSRWDQTKVWIQKLAEKQLQQHGN